MRLAPGPSPRATFGDDITGSYGKTVTLRAVHKTIAGRGCDTILIGLPAAETAPEGRTEEQIKTELGYPPE